MLKTDKKFLKDMLYGYKDVVKDTKIILNKDIKINKIEEGMIIDIPTNNIPITVLILDRFANDIYTCVLMSYVIEFKSKIDLIVDKIEHFISDTFIIETEFIMYIKEDILKRSYYVDKLDKKLHKKIVDYMYSDEDIDYKEDDIIKEFKMIEYERIKGLCIYGIDNLASEVDEAE